MTYMAHLRARSAYISIEKPDCARERAVVDPDDFNRHVIFPMIAAFSTTSLVDRASLQ